MAPAAGHPLPGRFIGSWVLRPRTFSRSSQRSADSAQLREAYAFFHPTIRRVRPSGRILVLGTPPDDAQTPRQATAQQALEGFVRSMGKEVRRGATAQLVYVGKKAEDQIESTLRFYLSPKSAYVSGQVVRIGASALSAGPLAARIVLTLVGTAACGFMCLGSTDSAALLRSVLGRVPALRRKSRASTEIQQPA